MSCGQDTARWFRRFGRAERDGFRVCVSDADEGWDHTSLRVAHLDAGEEAELDTGTSEVVVVPLSGSFDVEVTVDGGALEQLTLAGRTDVFSGPTDTAYIPPSTHLMVRATGSGPGRVALCGAVATRREAPLPARHLPAEEVPVELRGAGTCSREVRNFGTPGVLDADSIIACEVITPAGNWSSYPPHKHDEERPGEETALEEIYYCEVQAAEGVGTEDPMGYLRVYGRKGRPIDVLAEVRTGDVVLVPHGWHGPAMAPPDADLYYLNVMAGSGAERAWLICDDPAHAGVRPSWEDQEVDPRLPFGGAQ